MIQVNKKDFTAVEKSTYDMLQLCTICSPVQFNTIQTKLHLANQVLLQASEKRFLLADFFFFLLEWLKEAKDRIKSSCESLGDTDIPLTHTQKYLKIILTFSFKKVNPKKQIYQLRGDQEPIL